MDANVSMGGRFHRQIALPLLLAVLFTSFSVVASLRQGQLSVPTTYDDISYFVDAARRLQTLYDSGLPAFLATFVSEPPHAPLATLVSLSAFALMGLRDWAPAIINGVWVFLLLLCLRIRLSGRPWWVYLCVALAVLAWPLTGFLVIETRPDIVCGLMTAFGTFIVVSRPWIEAPKARIAWTSIAIGLALLAKPSVSPVTLALYGWAMLVASLADWRASNRQLPLGKVVRTNLSSLAIVVICTLPYYAIGLRQTVDYIYVSIFGQEKDLWALQLSIPKHAFYYLWGTGGNATMGRWLFVTLALLAGLSILRWRSVVSDCTRIASIAAVALAAYVLVSIPAQKSPFLGIVFSCLCLFLFITAAAIILEWCARRTRGGSALQAAFCAGLLAMALSCFQPHWYYRSGGSHVAEAPAISERRFALIQTMGEKISASEHNTPRVFLPAITNYLNADILTFELMKRRKGDAQAFDAHRSGDHSLHLSSVEQATHVVLFDTADPELLQRLPSTAVLPTIVQALQDHPSFRLLAKFPAATGPSTIALFERRGAFDGVKALSGFLPLEGPYPQWNLPRVRWALGEEARIRFSEAEWGASRLTFRAHSPLANQVITVLSDGVAAGSCSLPQVGQAVDCAIDLSIASGKPEIMFRFARADPSLDGGRTVLFYGIALTRR